MLWCVGVGNPLSPERTRMLLALRINVLAKGHSGISLETLHSMIQAFNGELQLYTPASLNLSHQLQLTEIPLIPCLKDNFCHFINYLTVAQK